MVLVRTIQVGSVSNEVINIGLVTGAGAINVGSGSAGSVIPLVLVLMFL